MNQNFTLVANVIFSHEYTEKELFDGFSIGWSAESEQIMSNLKVLIKPFQGGLNVMCENPELLVGESQPILIQLKLKSPTFFNYTDFGSDVRPNSGVFHFELPSPKQELDTLHHQDYVSADDVLAILSQKNLEDFNGKNKLSENPVEDHLGNIIPTSELIRYFFQTGESVIKVKEGQKVTQYYKGAGNLEKLPFGIIAVNMEGLLQKFQEEGGSNTFQIRFKVRKTIWKYILSDKVFDKFSRLAVIDIQNKEIQFTEKEYEIQSAWKVRSFESSEAIPYRVSSKSRFQLIEKSSDDRQAGKVVFKQLPDAKPEQLNQIQANTDLAYSHIFI